MSDTTQQTTGSAQSTTDGSADTFDPTQHVVGFNASTMKRADWEAFEFSVTEEGNVLVRNTSHENPDEHTYHVVTDARGIPKWCLHKLAEDADDDWEPCPAMAYHASPKNTDETEEHIQRGDYHVCKHCLGYARNEAIVRAVRQVKQNGGDN